jgi:hypothetical protein
MRRRLVLALALSLGVVSMASADTCRSLTTLTWLLGRWEAVGEKTTVYERWAAVSTETWEGYGETHKTAERPEDRTVLERESLRLVNMGDAIFYLAKVAHNALPVAFTLVDCGEDHAVFTNPEHDFPRRIEYRLAGNGMDVHVSDGEPEGKGFTLHFTRR